MDRWTYYALEVLEKISQGSKLGLMEMVSGWATLSIECGHLSGGVAPVGSVNPSVSIATFEEHKVNPVLQDRSFQEKS